MGAFLAALAGGVEGFQQRADVVKEQEERDRILQMRIEEHHQQMMMNKLQTALLDFELQHAPENEKLRQALTNSQIEGEKLRQEQDKFTLDLDKIYAEGERKQKGELLAAQIGTEKAQGGYYDRGNNGGGAGLGIDPADVEKRQKALETMIASGIVPEGTPEYDALVEEYKNNARLLTGFVAPPTDPSGLGVYATQSQQNTNPGLVPRVLQSLVGAPPANDYERLVEANKPSITGNALDLLFRGTPKEGTIRVPTETGLQTVPDSQVNVAIPPTAFGGSMAGGLASAFQGQMKPEQKMGFVKKAAKKKGKEDTEKRLNMFGGPGAVQTIADVLDQWIK